MKTYNIYCWKVYPKTIFLCLFIISVSENIILPKKGTVDIECAWKDVILYLLQCRPMSL